MEQDPELYRADQQIRTEPSGLFPKTAKYSATLRWSERSGQALIATLPNHDHEEKLPQAHLCVQDPVVLDAIKERETLSELAQRY